MKRGRSQAANLPVVAGPRPAGSARIKPAHDRKEDFSIYQPAGLKLRWYALTLDITLIMPIDVLVHLPFQRYLERLTAYGDTRQYWALWCLLNGVTVLMMIVAPTVLWGQTLGKKIVGIRVIRADFRPELTPLQVFVRETVGKFLSVVSLGVGFLMAGYGERGLALHDHLSRTHVIRYRLR